jgi:hypothetical protein
MSSNIHTFSTPKPMNPTLPTARDIKKASLLKACADAEAKYNAFPCKETSEAMDNALDAYNAFHDQGRDTAQIDFNLKLAVGCLTAGLVTLLIIGFCH